MKTRIKILFSFTICMVFFQQTGYSQCTGTFTVNAGPDATLCPGSAGITLGGTPIVTGGTAPYTYSWAPAAGLSCTNCPNPVATGSTTTTYTLTVSDQGNNCTGSDQVTITAGAVAPSTGFNFFPTTPACANIPVQFTNTSTPGLTYAWNFGDPASGTANTSTAINPTHVFTATGTGTQNFTVTLTVTSASGCQSTVTHVVTVKQTPLFSLSDPNFDFKNCGGNTFDLTAVEDFPSTGISNYQIQWGDGSANYNSPTFPAAGVTHTYTTQEIFDLLYIVTGTNGCIDTLSEIVTNITNPAIGAANPGGTSGCGPLEICFPLNNYSLNHSTTTYRVDFGDGSPTMSLSHPPPAVICHTYTQSSCSYPGSAFTFKIIAKNLCDSSQATITPIRVYRPPVAAFSSPNPVCTGSSVPFTNLTVNGYNSACNSNATYLWDFGDGTATSSAVSPSHVFSVPGSYTVTLTAGNPTCGTTTVSHVICVENPPVNSYTISQNSGCIPFTTQVTNNSTTLNTCNVARTWTVLFNGNSCSSSSGNYSYVGGTNANSFEPQFMFTSPGSYTIRQTLTNACGNFTIDRTVTAQSAPVVTVNNLSTICAGQSVSPSASVNNCYATADSYNWILTGGTPSTASTLSPGSVNYPTAGSYTLTLQATNVCGTSSSSKPLTVNPLPPLLNPTVNGPLCVGGTAVFTAASVAGVTYHWSGPNGYSSTQQNPTISNVTLARGGTYSVYATIGNCTGPTQSVTLVVNPIPSVNAGANFQICRYSSITLNGSPAGGTWSGTGITSAGVFTPQNTGTVNLTYYYTSPAGCSSSDVVTATVNALPNANAGADRTLCNQPIATTLTGSPAGGTWTGTGITNASGQFTPTTNGTFPVVYTATNANGCVARDTMIITVVDPTAAVAGPDITLCANAANVQLTGSPAGGTWSGSGITSAGLFDPTVGGTFPMVYNLGAGSCLTKDTMLFIVNPLPVINAGTNFSICSDAGTSTRIGTPAGGTWSGTGITPAGVFDPLISGAGNFVLTYSYTDPVTTCTNSASITASVTAKPVVNAGPDLTLCNQPIAVTLTGTPAGGTWTGTGVTNPSGQYTPSSVGVFEVVYTYTNASGCFNRDTILVDVGNPTYSNAGADSTVCIDAANVQLTGIPAGGTWTGNGINATGLFDPTVAGNFNLVYNVGAGTCITRDTMVMIVNPLPVVDAGANFNICINAPNLSLTGTPSGGTWAGTGITPAGIFTPSAAGAGAFTLTYTYVDPMTHCLNSDVLTANVRPLPVPNFNYNPVVCGNVATSFTNTTNPTGTYEWDFGDGSSTAATSPNHTYTSVGFFDVQLIATTQYGCIDSITKPIEVREPPTADFTLSQDSACAPVLVDFTNSSGGISVSYNWNFGNGQTSTLQNPPTVTYLQGIDDTTYHVSLTVTNACGTATHTEDVIAMPKPKSIFGTNFDFGCSPFAVEIVNNSTGLPDDFEWDFGDGTFSTDPGQIVTHVFTTGLHDTTFTITLVANNECGTDTSEYEIMVLPNQVHAFFNTNITAGCVPLTVEFTDFSTGGNVHTWDFGDQNSSTQLSPTHTFMNPGTYTVYSYVNDGCGYDTASVQITVYPSPVVNFSSMPDSVCINELFTFTNLSGNLASSAWDFGDGETSGFTNPTHGYAASGTYQVTLTGASVNNLCTASITKPVVVAVNPVAIYTGTPMSGCAPLQVSFNNNSTNATFQTWTYDDGNFSSQLSPPHTFTNPGTYTVKLLVENSNGCRDSVSHVVTAYAVPTADFDITTSNVCYTPATLTTSNTSSGGTDYAWTFGNGQTSTLTSPTTTYANPGTYTVQLTTSNAYGCSNVHSESVTFYPTPVATFTVSDDTLCLGETVTLASQSNFATSIVWNMGDGTQLTGSPINHTYATPGIYTVRLIAFGAGGCSDTITTTVGVYPVPVADFDFTLTDPCYTPATLTTINTSTGGTTYAWNFGNGQTSALTGPSTFYNTQGTYNIQLTTSTPFGCLDSHTESVTIYPTPSALFTISKDTICLGETITLSSLSTFATSITWIMGDGNELTGNSISYTYGTEGVYNISAIAYGAGGCSDTLTIFAGVVVHPKPLAGFDYYNVEPPLSGTVQFTNTSIGANYFTWDFGNGSTSHEMNPAERYPGYHDYLASLIAFNQFGCSDTIEQIVIVQFFSGLHVPNAIYPGHPEFGVANFLPKGVNLATYEVLIYDDWGNLIWQSTALDSDGRPTESWNGTYNGEPVQQDAYVWKISATFKNTKSWRGKEYDDGKFRKSGTVTVIR